MGGIAVVLMLIAVQVHQHSGSELAHLLAGIFMFTAFFLLVVLGIMPWVGTLALKNPIQNTEGFHDGYAAEPEKEKGPYMSQGWRRKRERASLRNLKAFGLYIEPDEKN
jgi:hypothetical protein